jgi:peptidoglycan biosynthesis protein MviN/MurJ (putative lipid II flippase)
MGTEISSFIYKDILVFLGFGTGKISDETIGEIGKMLLYFSPGILCFGLITIVNRGFQGLKMFYLPVIGSVVSVTLNYILMTFLVPVMDLAGLPAAISIASFVNLIVLLTLFHMKNKVSYQTFFFTGAKSVIAGSFLFFFIFGLKRIMDIPLFWKTPLILLSGSSFYFLVLLALKEQDIFRLYKALKRRVKAKLSRPPQK